MPLAARLVRAALSATGAVAPPLAARAATSLFHRPLSRLPLRPVEEPVLRRATQDVLQVNGRPVVVHTWGDGTRPVLLVHGWKSRAACFTALADALAARGFTPVAFDAPAHGASGGATSTILDFRAIMLALHARHGRFAAVVGHSVGALGTCFALREGLTADRLVTISAPATFPHLFDSFCALTGVRDSAKPALRRSFERRLFPGEHDIWERFSATHRPEQLTLPLMVVHDREDRAIPFAQAERLVAAYADRADLFVTQGLGHRRILSDPRVVEAVLAFTTAGEQASHPAA
ncbi:alpha/beta hydrolase [Streptomyces avicenniae]|uniref:alpha/beta hydrolase n=1 Tax=Streptomyces avicenniae TaxID=500153 RepID=UPI00069B759C|nr:alpha/beta hydrolase [Streptomyces avicenniae]